ncbi:hypothetical protein JB92DRAFT_2833961 [Gautieria morchelliformis]|nr:hypothetical protein JB92DRAFT_2833961 [Gautieria morchelliformis]
MPIIVHFLTGRVTKSFAKRSIWEAIERGLLPSIKATIATVPDGSRAWPKRSQDQVQVLGVRLDWGEKFGKPGNTIPSLVPGHFHHTFIEEPLEHEDVYQDLTHHVCKTLIALEGQTDYGGMRGMNKMIIVSIGQWEVYIQGRSSL